MISNASEAPGIVDDAVIVEASGIVVAPGGWRRAAIAFAMGIVAGAAVALVLPRDDAPRRR